ncbi:MAG: beta-hydroxyacyl-ACP dehydratase [Puniceicoccales bacterium]|jgi:3-hydroxyacyl-[acyl-carrier-protein] dehydratase|nr:beta-hydroxyacyl-ACP dehydratase [Puniceicoccales bacterium]
MVDPKDVIPHRPPFLFVDEILEVGDGHAIGKKTFKKDEFFYKGHYPGQPITPGVILCEAIFQVAAFFAINKLAKDSGPIGGITPVLAKINDARFKRIVLPGSTVMLKAEFLESMGKFMMMRGSAFHDKKVDVSIGFSIAFTDSR